MSIILPDLPYENDALEPHISSKTLSFHHGKHHNAYVTNLNKLIEGTDLNDDTLEDIIKRTFKNDEKTGIFKNAAQVWNHTFYWQSMKPNGGGLPSGNIADKINADFGGYDNFVEKMKNAGLTQFGSGWAWLILKDMVFIKIINRPTKELTGHDKTVPVIPGVINAQTWRHKYFPK